jgi:hypothetical protein
MPPEIEPTIIMPSRDFLIGVLYGYNTGRKQIELNPVPTRNDRPLTNEDFYLGYWLEFECCKCGRHYGFDNPNHLPMENLVCESEDCNNHVIVYGIGDPKVWKIGQIKFVN